MPHTLEFDRASNLVRIEYSGLVTLQEYFRVIEELAALDGFGPSSRGISVFLDADVDVDRNQLQEIVARLEFRGGFEDTAWAFVIDEPRKTAIGLLYQLAAQGLHRVEIFSTEQAAIEWIESLRLPGRADSGDAAG